MSEEHLPTFFGEESGDIKTTTRGHVFLMGYAVARPLRGDSSLRSALTLCQGMKLAGKAAETGTTGVCL